VWTTTTAAASSIGSAYCLGDSVAAVVVDDDVVGINDINFCQCE